MSSDMEKDAQEKYIIGRPFLVGDDWMTPGDLLPRDVEIFHLQSLVAAGFLYRYVPKDGYDRLPPHVFSAVATRQEIKGLIEKGDAPVVLEWEESEPLREARELKEAELNSLEQNRIDASKRALKQFEEFQQSQVEARPVVVPHKAVPVDSTKKEAEEAAVEEGTDYEKLTKDELLEEIHRRNDERSLDDAPIAVGGNKPDLIQRLVEDDLKR